MGDNETSLQFKRRITKPGLYFFTVDDVETKDNGTVINHSDTVSIMVDDLQLFDAKLKGKWGGVRSTLSYNDVVGAAKYFTSSTKSIYLETFDAMPDQLSQMAQDMADLQLIKTSNNRAEYDVRVTRNGKVFSYFVLFVKDENGLWKIKSF